MYTAKSFIEQDGYYTVTLERSQDKRRYCMDVAVESSKDISADWNQYIFHKNNQDDMEREQVQDDIDEYLDASNEAVNYLENQHVIFQDTKGDWYVARKRDK